MKNVYIIHGWGANSNSDWFPWLKKELEARGYNVFVPDMPDTDNPVIESWVNKMKELSPDAESILIGHSIGCQAIIRYLADTGARVKKIILVCPWLTLKDLEDHEWPIADPWLKEPIDFEKVKKAGGEICAIFSDNDAVVPVENEELFKKNLNATTRMYHEKGHFNAEDEIVEIPEIMEYID